MRVVRTTLMVALWPIAIRFRFRFVLPLENLSIIRGKGGNSDVTLFSHLIGLSECTHVSIYELPRLVEMSLLFKSVRQISVSRPE